MRLYATFVLIMQRKIPLKEMYQIQEQEQNTNSNHDNNEEDDIISNNIKATIESLNNKSL